jgi:PAS domain S-box-containing protein
VSFAPGAAQLTALPLDLVPDGIVVVDDEAVIVAVNRYAGELFGYSEEELVGKPMELLVPERHRRAHAAHLRAFFADPRTRPMAMGAALTGRRRDGSEFPVDISLAAIADEHADLPVAAIRDVTARGRAQAQLERSASDLEEVQRLARLGSWHWDPLAGVREWSIGMFLIYDRDPIAGPMETEASLEQVLPEDRARVRDAYDQMAAGGEGFTLDYRMRAADGGWRAVHAIARPDPDRPGCFRGTLQDITELWAAEQALRASEQRLASVIANAPIGMAVVNAGDSQCVQVNRALCQMLGYSEQELLGPGLLAVMEAAGDRKVSPTPVERMLSGEIDSDRVERRYLIGAGEPVWVRLTGRLVRDRAGAPEYYINQYEDITASKAAAEVQARLAAVVADSYDAIITTALDGTILTWNAAAERLYGHSAAEAIGRPIALLAPGPEQERELADVLHRVAAGERVESLDTTRRTRARKVIDVAITVSPVRDSTGAVIAASTVARDITERKRAVDALRTSQQLLERAELSAGMGSWEWDLATGEVVRSAGLLSVFRLDPAQGAESIEQGVTQRVHPDDRERVREALDQVVSRCTPVGLQFRVIRPDGHVRIVDWRVEPIVDARGEAVRVIGIVRDITEARQTEETLSTTSASLIAYAQELQRLAMKKTFPGEPAPAALTAKQLEILHLIAQGLTSAKIAEQLHLSEPTVKWHVKQILAKTNSATRSEAVARVLGANA